MIKKFRLLKNVSVLGTLGALAYVGYREYHKVWYPPVENVIAGKKHIACIGDSITYGAGVAKTRDKDSYPVLLGKMVPENWQVINYGLSGRTLLNEGDNPYTRELYFDVSKNTLADIYIILLGTNDSKPFNWEGNEDRFADELREFVRQYKDLENHPEVIVMQPPKCFPPKPGKPVVYKIQDEPIAGPIYEAIRKVCKETGCRCLDLYSLTLNHPEYFQDGVHPNALGNLKIAEFVCENIKDLL